MDLLPHLKPGGTGHNVPYKRGRGGGGRYALPPREDRRKHGLRLQREIMAAQSQVGWFDQTAPAGRVITLKLRSAPGFELALKDIERERHDLELLSARQRGDVWEATFRVGA